MLVAQPSVFTALFNVNGSIAVSDGDGGPA